MLSKSEKRQLSSLLKDSISGVVLKSDLKEWLLKLQDQSIQMFNSCDSMELINVAQNLGIRVVNTKAEYNKLKDKYECMYSVPNLLCKAVKRENRKLEKEVLEEMIVVKKMKQHEVAAELHTSPNMVAKYVRDYEIKGRNQQIKMKLTKELLEELYSKQGMKAYSIAKMVGCKPDVVSKYIEKYNLKAVV